MTTIVQPDGKAWCVWAGLDGEDPRESLHGFIIGQGDTRDEAVADAVRELEAATERLQSPVDIETAIRATADVQP